LKKKALKKFFGGFPFRFPEKSFWVTLSFLLFCQLSFLRFLFPIRCFSVLYAAPDGGGLYAHTNNYTGANKPRF
jgi:hypothetical protein